MQVSIIPTPCTTWEHHKPIFLHEKRTPHTATSPPNRHSHYHAHEASICFKLLPHPPYFRTHCCNKTYHGEPTVDPLWCRHIKRERISKFGVCLGHWTNRMRVWLRWLWEWGWLLGVGGVGWWLFDRGNFFWSYVGVWIRWVWRWISGMTCGEIYVGVHAWWRQMREVVK